ncbi:MAG: hypothetical protein P4M11_02105 [Candidatus Pacebacteria bacterium]|nr:hypothetical protein [Candidatus Paceibacterota bacterium]
MLAIICMQRARNRILTMLFSLSRTHIEDLIKRSQDFVGVVKGEADAQGMSTHGPDEDEERQAQPATVFSNRLTGSPGHLNRG